MSEKIKHRSNLTESSGFLLTGGRMIIFSGNYTFVMAIMSVFRKKNLARFGFY